MRNQGKKAIGKRKTTFLRLVAQCGVQRHQVCPPYVCIFEREQVGVQCFKSCLHRCARFAVLVLAVVLVLVPFCTINNRDNFANLCCGVWCGDPHACVHMPTRVRKVPIWGGGFIPALVRLISAVQMTEACCGWSRHRCLFTPFNPRRIVLKKKGCFMKFFYFKSGKKKRVPPSKLTKNVLLGPCALAVLWTVHFRVVGRPGQMQDGGRCGRLHCRSQRRSFGCHLSSPLRAEENATG